jgi:hypothetical protein
MQGALFGLAAVLALFVLKPEAPPDDQTTMLVFGFTIAVGFLIAYAVSLH